MNQSIASRILLPHLGRDAHACGLLASRRFRSVWVTHHRVNQADWAWCARPASTQTHCVVLFPLDAHGVPFDTDRRAARGLFLAPGMSVAIPWDRDTTMLAVWAPQEALSELSAVLHGHPIAIPASSFAVAFRSFTSALLHRDGDESTVSNYALERLLVEMMFGVVLEQHADVMAEERPRSLFDRAMAFMLARRDDPTFTVTHVADELHVSQRQLQRAFAREHTTPGDALRRLRVELAESMLSDDSYRPLGIEEIARYSGFTGSGQLRRALLSEGKPGPSAFRGGVLARTS